MIRILDDITLRTKPRLSFSKELGVILSIVLTGVRSNTSVGAEGGAWPQFTIPTDG